METIYSKKIFLLVLLITQSLWVLSDITTLTKEGKITCVVSEPGESAIFINPPVKSESTKTTKEIGNWINDDWFTEEFVSSLYNPITDKRWEDLKYRNPTDGVYLEDKPIALSIYIYGSVNVIVYSTDLNWSHTTMFALNKSTVTTSNKNWFHFILRRENNTIQILWKNKVIQTNKIDIAGPYFVFFETPDLNTTFYKVHKYEFRWSNISKTTINQQESYVNVPFTDNLCLSMYVSIDKDCILQTTLISSNNVTTKIIPGFNQEHEFKFWKNIEIPIDSPGICRLFFNRINPKNKKDCYWAVDKLDYCDRDTEIYQTTVLTPTSGDHTCQMLNQPNAPTSEMSFFDKPGFLGDVSCETVLGPSYPFCESHKICQTDSTCLCSWGYQGQSCNTTCDEGRWGLFCIQHCTNCTNCHHATGACLEKELNKSEEEFSTSTALFSGQTHVKLPNYETINAATNTTNAASTVKDQEDNKADEGDNNLNLSSMVNEVNYYTSTTAASTFSTTANTTGNTIKDQEINRLEAGGGEINYTITTSTTSTAYGTSTTTTIAILVFLTTLSALIMIATAILGLLAFKRLSTSYILVHDK